MMITFALLLIESGTIFQVKEETRWLRTPLPGFVQSQHYTDLRSNRLARVVELPIEEGQRVEAGTLLLRLQDEALVAQVKALDVAIHSQRLAAEQALMQQQRMDRLLDRGAVSALQQEQAALQLQAERARLQELESQRSALVEQKEFLEFRAANQGQLVALHVALGQITSPGSTLATFAADEARSIRVPVPAHLVSQLKTARWEIRPNSAAAWENAELINVTSTPEAQLPTYSAYLAASHRVKARAQVDVSMLTPHRGIFIEASAIDQRGNISYVWCQKDGTAQRRIVRLGPDWGDGFRLVVSGLNIGDQISIGGRP